VVQYTVTVRKNQVVLNVESADERLVSSFSGRADRRVGRFAGRPQADRWVWDQEMFSLLGYRSGARPASTELLLRHVSEDERDLVADAFRSAVEQWRSFVVSCRLHTADGRFRSVLVVAELMETEPSGFAMSKLLNVDGLAAATGAWLAGHLIDLTELRLNATREAATHAVVEATRHRAVIEQAKGMLMLTRRIDADAAFLELCRHSQHTNTKLHEVAAGIVSRAAQGSRP